MAAVTPRRSSRLPHTHTPKMSERKKGLFVTEAEASKESLTKHRRLSVVDSESDSDDCDLGIISTLDSSSCDENDPNTPKTPERTIWHETRSHSRKLKETTDLKNFMKSPFTLKKYQTRYSCPETRCSSSTPATPHFQNHPGTPSSTHSCTSVHTTSSTSSRARKSLASLIADTESCSSSLKDLNFDTDSGSDSKENTPTKSTRRSKRFQKMTPKLQSFKGILMEQKKNVSPMKTAYVCLTKMDMSNMMSPTQMQKTPHNTTEAKASPPKISHNRRSAIEILESPESNCDSEKSHKRLHYDDKLDSGPVTKYPRLDPSTAPKARLSLFNSERLKEILSTKSFYGKSNPDMNSSITAKISNAIQATATHKHRPFHSHSNKRKRKPGQINMGVRHRIKKPKALKKSSPKGFLNTSVMEKSIASNKSLLNSTMSSRKDDSMLSQNTSQEMEHDKTDPFDKEKQTIEALLSQWTEEEVPESELIQPKELPCFNSTVIEETNSIFQPIIAVPVASSLPQDDAVIVEIGAQNAPGTGETLPQEKGSEIDVIMDGESHAASHGDPPSGQFLPVEGGYIVVDGTVVYGQQEIPDLDEIDRELKMLDEQILKMAQSNNIDAQAVLASTETIPDPGASPVVENAEKAPKLFPIFSKPNPGLTPTSKDSTEKTKKKSLLKNGSDQYVIDAGQKKFGATQCNECGVIYQIGDPQDEHDHLIHHNATDVLKFNGWKDEYIVEKTPTGRIIRVRGGDTGWKRVESVLSRVVHPQLGYTTLTGDVHAYTAYLYIEKKQIVGCLIVEPKSKAYKLLPGDPDCCSVEEYPVKCGISRIWTHPKFRRRGIAVRMLECARASFLYGLALTRQELAFSAPTPAGKALASLYCGTENFYVYLS
ncbi:N-acetyltransferase ESCO1 [Zerene cesonia]|uniref:N-acetyltransferase ESCO1 n=1 Tax=Zerene cesonia TaxID=33412 RepID=UPI0018E543DE|nr:N-acetyltransferase ESCO1 [Zerene cesonia]